MLESAVQIDVMPGQAHQGGTTVDLVVRVTNLSGHKFPTGYADGRRAFLQVELQDAQGASLALLGRYDDATAHLDAASELRVWESIQAEHLSGGGHREWHIAKNDTVVKDTRIPPAGFQPTGAAAIAMTAPVGADYGPVTGMRNYDDVPVRFSSLAPLPPGSLRVTARVFYQSTMREFVEELARANTTDDRGTKLMAIWEQTGRAAPRLIASKTADVTVGPPVPRQRRRRRRRRRRRPRRRRDVRPPRTNRSVAAVRSRRPSTDGRACSSLLLLVALRRRAPAPPLRMIPLSRLRRGPG